MLRLRRKRNAPTRSGGDLTLSAVSKRFKGSAAPALDRVSLTVQEGGTTAVLGESGSGKTTLLRLVAGFEELDAGTIEVGDLRVAGGRRSLPPEERNVGVVFQDTALLPHLTLRQNIAFGLQRLPEPAREQRVDAVVELVRVGDAQDRYPHQVSGGQAQRAAIGRALAPRPRVLLLDEPLNNLDGPLRDRLIDELRSILALRTTTAIFVTHDRDEAFRIADRVAVLRNGRLQQTGTPEDLYWSPANGFVASLLGKTNLLGVRRNGAGWVTDLGPVDAAQPIDAGGRRVVSIRPGQVRVSAAATDGPSRAGPSRPGTVVTERFLGEVRELTIALHGERGPLQVIAHAGAATRFAAGDHVFVSLRTDQERRGRPG